MISLTVRLVDSNDFITMQFEESVSVFYACGMVWDRLKDKPDDHQASEFGFFKPDSVHRARGYWLQMDKTFAFYKLKNGEILEYKKRILSHCVRFLDDSVASLLLDNSFPVCDLVKDICKTIALPRHEDFSLTVDGDFPAHLHGTSDNTHKQLDTLKKKLYTSPRYQWLLSNHTLSEQGINQDVVLTLRRKFFVSTEPINITDVAAVNSLYVQNKKSIINGALLCTHKEAIKLAGLQCQITYGDHDSSKHKQEVLNLVMFLPRDYIQSKDVEKLIWKEHSSLINMSELDAMLSYIRLCHSLPTYGTHFALVREQAEKKVKIVPCLLGISKNGVIRVDAKTKNIMTSWPLSSIKRWGVSHEFFILDFGDIRKKYVVQTTEADTLLDLINGYISRLTVHQEMTSIRDTRVNKTQPMDQERRKNDEVATPNLQACLDFHQTTEEEYVEIEKPLPSRSVHKEAIECSKVKGAGNDALDNTSYAEVDMTESSSHLHSRYAVKGVSQSLSRLGFDLGSQPLCGSQASLVEKCDWWYPTEFSTSYHTSLTKLPSSSPSCQQQESHLDSQMLMARLLSTQAELRKTKLMLAFAETKVTMAEQRAAIAEQRALLSEQRAVFAEQHQKAQRQWCTLPPKHK